MKAKEKSKLRDLFVQVLLDSSKFNNIPQYALSEPITYYFNSIGYKTYKSYELYKKSNVQSKTVCFLLAEKCWVCLSCELAEKILCLGMVPILCDKFNKKDFDKIAECSFHKHFPKDIFK